MVGGRVVLVVLKVVLMWVAELVMPGGGGKELLAPYKECVCVCV